MLSDGKKSDGVILLRGRNNLKEPLTTANISEFENINYIANANYFLSNPKHKENDATDNIAGTCTTVAMQMLMEYHNYYSDRRIIPVSGNNRTFLNNDYGEITAHPNFNRDMGTEYGCPFIGTEDDFYYELFDRNGFAGFPLLGQAIGLVKNGAQNFINAFTPQAAAQGISLSSGFFSAEEARNDIDMVDLLY